MRVAAFTRYDRLAASTRQRLLQYRPSLAAAGIDVDYHPLLDDAYVRSLASGERYSRTRLARSYLHRMRELAVGPDCDVVWIYAELFPYLPAAFERLAFRSGKPVIYDFDDAFFHHYDDSPSAWVRRLLGGKLEPLLSRAAACCCGNRYLRDYAVRFCENSIVLPTVVDTDLYRPGPPKGADEPLTIGWIGSPSTWPDVKPLLPLLRRLCEDRPARLRVIGAGVAAERDRFAGMELVEWSEASEVAEVQTMDIGIMPLRDLPFQRGKSGYKLIQYMACAVPTVASPVGVNAEIVGDGTAGFLARSDEEWKGALERLLGSAQLRRRMGQAGRERVEARYSLASQAPRLIELFKSVAGQN